MISFDVFDTLITRKTAAPQGVFFLIREELQNNPVYSSINDFVRLNFCVLRDNAEKLTRLQENLRGKEDVTLRQIYSAMQMCGCLSETETALLYQLERDMELWNVLPIAANIQKVKEYAAQGEHVILISDMYLETEVVAAMLQKADPFLGTLPLYVSSEHQKTKWSGGLYRLIAKMENVSFQDWQHFGDNQCSDVEVPGRLGIKAKKMETPPFMGCEEYLLKVAGQDCGLQLQIGAARYARLEKDYGEAGKIGSSFGGEILLPYVLWILHQCQERKIQRLYFVARDGYLLKKIADKVIEERELEIETGYIYSSRKAWRVPAMACPEYDWDLVELIRWSHIEKLRNVSDLASVFELPEDEFLKYLPSYYRENPQHLLNSRELKLLVVQLQWNDQFKEYFRIFHSDRRDRVRRYLQENLDVSDDNFAFVEIGGSGLTQEYLSVLLKDIYQPKIKTFYFKIDRVFQSKWCEFDVYLPSFFKTNRLIEMICRAPHEQTVDYEFAKGRMQPVFQGNEAGALLDHGFLEFEEAILEFAKTYLRNARGFSAELLTKVENSNAQSAYLMEYAGEFPDKPLLDYLADTPTSETGRNNVSGEVFAPKLSKKDIWNIYWHGEGRNVEKYYTGSDLKYSVLRCSPREKRFLDLVSGLRKKLKSLKPVGGHKKRNVSQSGEEITKCFARSVTGAVSVYGAGKYGKLLVKELAQAQDVKLLHWWDRNFEELQKQGFEVENPDTIGEENGLVIIAVLNRAIAMEIRDKLVQCGIQKKDIILLEHVPVEGVNCWTYERLMDYLNL